MIGALEGSARLATDRSAPWRERRSDLVLWLALLAGFSPVLVDYRALRGLVRAAEHARRPGSDRDLRVAGHGHDRDEPRRAGLALIAAGLLLELVGIALRIWTFAWLGLPVAVLGMALWLGTPSWRIAVLAFGLVPIPESIRAAHTPAPETALLSGACAAWQALGVAFSCTGPVARIADRHLELGPDDVGWTLAPLLAQLGWFVAVNDGASGRRALRSAFAFAAAAVVVQPLAVGVALGLLAVSSEAVARAWLSPGVWLGCTAGVLLWQWRSETPPRAAAR